MSTDVFIEPDVGSPEDVRAFPSAEGFGRNATGGRGGEVIKVTTLADSGPGSLREAIEASGPRIVVFDVGGEIALESPLVISNPNLTIAGQSAPGEGIMVTGASVTVRASNIIIRYLRIRHGDGGYKNAAGEVVGSDTRDGDTFGITGGSDAVTDVIVDHCSLSWGIDENIGVFGGSAGVDRITIQNCIVAEGLLASHHDDGPHSMGMLINSNTQNISIYANLFAHHSERHIRAGGGCSFELVNNLFYDFRSTTVVSYDTQFSVISNVYKSGNTELRSSYAVDLVSQSGFAEDDTEAYVSDNLLFGDLTEVDPVLSDRLASAPVLNSEIPLLPADMVEAKVLNDVGARFPTLDAVDSRIIADYTNGTGELIDTQTEVGGFPTLAGGAPRLDTDNDGMPDDWERPRGLDPNDPSDASLDRNGDAYTNIEEYLNGLVD